MNQSLRIPPRFSQKLSQNQNLEGVVKKTVSNYSKILVDNTLFFFPEYTNHGIDHIEKILKGADRLIPDTTFDLLTDSDIAYFILAAVLHDLGMHHYHSTFQIMIQEKTIAFPEIDQRSWHDEWLLYLYEARKFDKKKLSQIFGDENLDVSGLVLDQQDKITGDGKKLVGEFIRRHHPRIAHEIAVHGFHAQGGNIPFADELRKDIRYLIGFSARSHGMDLRLATTKLEAKYPGAYRMIHHTHFIYLMVLLRLADYLDIDSSRTSQLLLRLKSYSTPFSAAEHRTHLAVDFVLDVYQDDREKIFVQASPATSSEFMKLNGLVTEIQKELDISWAVLGENYSRQENELKIRYRRISSNLDDKVYLQGLNYIPSGFVFKVSESLIKLLIGPLYGKGPSFGIRELVQNAVDACAEREVIDQSMTNYHGNIMVEIDKDFEKGKFFFRIEDDGKGMNENDLQNYFFMVGGSNRADVEWNKFYKDGNSTPVRKSGKFGIGVLAGFLIGPEIEVKTRKFDQPHGLTFRTTINSQQIDVFKDDYCKVGTSIKIYVDDSFLMLLKLRSGRKNTDSTPWYGWYTLDKPSITYSLLTQNVPAYVHLNPHVDSVLPATWKKFSTPEFDAIYWTYDADSCQKYLTCNGMVIPVSETDQKEFLSIIERKGDLISHNSDFDFIFHLPYLSIFDSRGNLPLSLNRNTLTDYLSFARQLRFEILKDIVERVVTDESHSVILPYKAMVGDDRVMHPSLNRADGVFGKRILSLDGFTVQLPHVESKRKHIRIALNGAVPEVEFNFKPDTNYTFDIHEAYGESENEYQLRGGRMAGLERLGLLISHQGGIAILVKENNEPFRVKRDSEAIRSVYENESVLVYSRREYARDFLKSLAELITDSNKAAIKYVIYDFEPSHNLADDEKLIKFLTHLFGNEERFISYDPKKRKSESDRIMQQLETLLTQDFI